MQVGCTQLCSTEFSWNRPECEAVFLRNYYCLHAFPLPPIEEPFIFVVDLEKTMSEEIGAGPPVEIARVGVSVAMGIFVEPGDGQTLQVIRVNEGIVMSYNRGAKHMEKKIKIRDRIIEVSGVMGTLRNSLGNQMILLRN